MKTLLSILMLTGSTLLSSLCHATDADIRLSTGLDYTQGKYTDDVKTEILYIPATIKALFGNVQAKVTVPYIRITGPGTVVGGGEIGPITRDRPPEMITTESGLGDVTASLSYLTSSQNNTLFVDFTTKVKLPTASRDKNLGTGETDVTVQVDIAKKIGSVNWLGTAGYRFMGDSDVLPLQDGFVGSAGLSVDISPGTSLGLIYDYRESASFAANSPSELTGFISFKVSDRVRLQTYGVVGFSNGSPDSGVGIQFSFRP